MKVIRTFHPVGQGAFYSERFYEEGKQEAKHNIVFDCGAGWGYKKKAEHVVSQAFDKNDIIDYLFLSHLDYDHISLVDKLLSQVKRVARIVLPLVAVEDVIIIMSLIKISYPHNVPSFYQKLIDYLQHGTEDNYWGNDYRIIFVGDPGDSNRTDIWKNGAMESVSWEPEWVLIPYNTDIHSRAPNLIKSFDQLIKKAVFLKALQQAGWTGINTGSDLYNRLTDVQFVNSAICDNTLRKGIRDAYDSVEGGVNANSLIVYSGPINAESGFILRRNYAMAHLLRYGAGWLFTGDSNADMPVWKKYFSKVWDCLGTVQLPHHGSGDSFDMSVNSIDKQLFF